MNAVAADLGAASASAVARAAERYVTDLATLDPLLATRIGMPQHDGRLPDYSPDGHAARADLARATRVELRAASEDGHQWSGPDLRRAAVALDERLGTVLAFADGDLDLAELNAMDSPVQAIRMCFGDMRAATPQDWELITQRLRAVPQALAGVRQSVCLAADRGVAPARRQVLQVAEQCAFWSGANEHDLSVFDVIAARGWQVPGADIEAVQDGAALAAAAFADFAAFLRTDIVSRAREADAWGEATYLPASRRFTGTEPDLRATYSWAWEEFLRVEAETRIAAARIAGHPDPRAAVAALDSDPRYRIDDPDHYLGWLREHTDAAAAAARDVGFDIPPELARCECRVAQTHGIPAHYTPPTQDFTRPGRLWWSIEGLGPFSTWRDHTRIYHEGFPGHHLQVGSVIANRERLTTFQRLCGQVAAHGEGWAVYAERLMDEAGQFEDAGYRFGLLDGQLLRAARLVLDLGLHLELPVPGRDVRWNRDLAVAFLRERTTTGIQQCQFEVDRYLAWPGQATSYKLGERVWLAARADARLRFGARWELADFHRQALAMGPLGLDVLATELGTLEPGERPS